MTHRPLTDALCPARLLNQRSHLGLSPLKNRLSASGQQRLFAAPSKKFCSWVYLGQPQIVFQRNRPKADVNRFTRLRTINRLAQR